jgi:ubiquinone/menaquinone biosynthesis C-methylase UbiE
MSQKDYWEREELSGRRSPEHPVVREYALSKITEITRHVPLTKDVRLLDVGCGNGFFTYHLDKVCDAWGVDFSQKMLDLNPVKKTRLMDASDLKFPDDSFDVVFCHALLHHVDDPHKAVSEMARVSKRHVILLEPNRNNPLMFLFSAIVPQERAALRFSLSHLRDLAEGCNLEVNASFSHGMLVPNKTPTSLLPLFRLINFRQPLGMTNFVIASKSKR